MLKSLVDYISLLYRSRIIFSVKPKNIVIFDCVNSYELSKILDNDKFIIISSRKITIYKLYFTKNIILFVITNLFKRKLKLNYMIALIKEINPEIVITNIDNSIEFSLLAKFFYKKIDFIAVQTANRGDIFGNYANANKTFFLPILICFSKFDIQLFKKKKINVKKYLIAGSLKNSVFKLENKSKNKSKIKYDICFISKILWDFNSNNKRPEYENITTILIFLAKYAKAYNKKILVQSKGVKNFKELNLYKQIFKGTTVKILWRQKIKYNSYKSVSKSSLILGGPSTLLREAYYFNKKVLCCDLFESVNINSHPFRGINYIANFNYSKFEKRLNVLFKLNFQSYLKRLQKPKNFYMSDINTAQFIKTLTRNIIENNRKTIKTI